MSKEIDPESRPPACQQMLPRADGTACADPAREKRAPVEDRDDAQVEGDRQSPAPRSIAPRARWIYEVDLARHTWELLQLPELRQTLGRAHLLSALVQRRYGLGRDVADAQVQQFFAGMDTESTRDSA